MDKNVFEQAIPVMQVYNLGELLNKNVSLDKEDLLETLDYIKTLYMLDTSIDVQTQQQVIDSINSIANDLDLKKKSLLQPAIETLYNILVEVSEDES